MSPFKVSINFLQVFLLIGCLLVGNNGAVKRHIDPDTFANVADILSGERNPERMMDLIEAQRRQMGQLDPRGSPDEASTTMIGILDNLLEMRQFAYERRCDDEVGDLLRATKTANIWKPDLSSGTLLDILIRYWSRRLVGNCRDNIRERLNEARARVSPAAIEVVESLMSDEFLDQFQSSELGELHNVSWPHVIRRLHEQRQNAGNLESSCQEFLDQLQNQVAIARGAIRWNRADTGRVYFVKKILMRVHFCEILAQSNGPASLNEVLRTLRD